MLFRELQAMAWERGYDLDIDQVSHHYLLWCTQREPKESYECKELHSIECILNGIPIWPQCENCDRFFDPTEEEDITDVKGRHFCSGSCMSDDEEKWRVARMDDMNDPGDHDYSMNW